MDNPRKKPVVFISSTCYDLSQVREDLKDFFEEDYGFEPMLSEFNSFPTEPCVGTFENCLSNVDNYADIFVLIVGTRYGYVTDAGKSITNLEYLHAKAKGIPMFVFVSKQIYNNLPIWRKNKEGDFSSIVDNSKIFEFVSEIYDESRQWIYTYDNVRDIKIAIKNQLCLIFSDGIKFQKCLRTPQFSVLNYDIPEGAIRAIVEQPAFWEYKFFAHVLKGEYDNLIKHKWDLQYGIFEGHTISLDTKQLIDDVSEKINEITKLIDMLKIIIDKAFQDAIGDLGVPSDLEMMIYVSKRFTSICMRLIEWSVYFKSIDADPVFSKLLQLLYEFPKEILSQIDDFVDRFHKEICMLPDVPDDEEHHINLTCKIDGSNSAEITDELSRLARMLV